MYRQRRLVEAGLPSGTFSTANEALVAQGLPGVAPLPWLMVGIAALQRAGQISQYPDGRFGPRVSAR